MSPRPSQAQRSFQHPIIIIIIIIIIILLLVLLLSPLYYRPLLN